MTKIKKNILAIFTIIYFIAVLLLHLPVSNLMSKPINTLAGTLIIRDWSIPAGLLILFLILILLWKNYQNGSRKKVTLLFWGLTLLYILVLYKYFLIHPVEFAHYVQYGIPAILIAYINDPDKTKFDLGTPLLITSAVGIFDECFQYFYTCPAYNNYLDITDMLLNVVAAGVGVMIYYSFRTPDDSKSVTLCAFYRTISFRIILAAAVLIVTAWSSGHLHFHTNKNIPARGIYSENGRTEIYLERESGVYGSFRVIKSFKTGEFYVTPPFSGFLLIFLTYAFFSLYDPRFLRHFGIKSKE